MFKREDFGAVEELRKVLGAVNGVKNVQERIGLEYILTVDNDENKTGAERVAEVLKNSASKYNLDLEIVVATEKEMKDVQEKLMAQFSKGKA